jgi:hypothetical protein
MKKDLYLKNFIETIQNEIPQRGKLAEVLAELLCIEKEAVYRRLRGSVAFSFQEIFKIALYFGFSLDSIAEGSSTVSKLLVMRMIEFINPTEADYKMLENFCLYVRQMKGSLDSEFGSMSSLIPTTFCVSYPYIYKFYLFKWTHQFSNPQKVPAYTEVKATDRLNRINRDFVESIQNSSKSIYIFDRQFIYFFVNDVRYFFDIKLISKEDVLDLKRDLLLYLDDLERYASGGVFDTGKSVEIYLANVHFYASCNYIGTSTNRVTMIRLSTFSEAYSFDETIFENTKKWLNFLKQTSTMISVSNVPERVLFFEKQREFVNNLLTT